MRIHLCVVGRLRAGPEKDLLDDYVTRFDRSGRGLGLGPVQIKEVDAKGAGMDTEATLLRKAIPSAARFITMDERGKTLTSPDFAKTLGTWRDQGQGNVAFVIGGADGIAPSLRTDADLSISFGSMVWPHMLARVMLAEQLYRAASILAGSPYHRA